MSWKKLQIPAVLLLGVLLGFGVASYRAFLPDQFALAGEKEKKGPEGIFSPPGTFDGGTVTPPPNPPPFKGKVGRTIGESTPDWPPLATAPKGAPNVLYIVLDDVGYAAIGCYGSPVCKTPHMDKLAKNGVRYSNFHTTALCSPSRSAFLTGRNHHSNAMACITEGSTGFPGSYGRVPLANGFLSEMLTPFGWTAFAIGKWHLTPAEDMNLGCNRKWWPLGRGFDRFYGFLGGEVDQWTPWLTYDNHFIKPPKTPEEGYHNVPDLTDKAKEFIADLKQVAPDRPFFMYFCPGACHAPHHAPKEWIAKYKGAFDAGWDDYREKALENQIKLGICPAGTKLSPPGSRRAGLEDAYQTRERDVRPPDGSLRRLSVLRRSLHRRADRVPGSDGPTRQHVDHPGVRQRRQRGRRSDGLIQRESILQQHPGHREAEPQAPAQLGRPDNLSPLFVGLGARHQHAVPPLEA